MTYLRQELFNSFSKIIFENEDLVTLLLSAFRFTPEFCLRLKIIFGSPQAQKIILQLGRKSRSSYWLNALKDQTTASSVCESVGVIFFAVQSANKITSLFHTFWYLRVPYLPTNLLI